jgi:hypothetical protein
LNEGIAQWVDGHRLDPKSRDALVTYQITRRVPDILHLDGVIATQRNPYNDTQMTLAYMKSCSLVEFLVESYGMAEILQMAAEFDSADATDRLFREHFNYDAGQIDELWLKWIERKKIEKP